METSAWANVEEVAVKNDPSRKIMRIAAALHSLNQQHPAVVETTAPQAASSRSRARVSLLADPEEPGLSTNKVYPYSKQINYYISQIERKDDCVRLEKQLG